MLRIATHIGESEIDGIGLFTDEFLKRGRVIWEFDVGLDLSIEESFLNRLPDHVQKFIRHHAYKILGTRTYVLCGDNARYFNHNGEHPNIVSVGPTGVDVAGRDISPGEELTVDYFTFDEDAEVKLMNGPKAWARRQLLAHGFKNLQ
jgi:SET domain-containing protein